MPRLASSLKSPRSLLLLAAVVVILIVGGLFAIRSRQHPLLETPEFALSSLQAKTLYFNGRARPWLLAHRPDLLASESRDDQSERTRAFAQAAQDPKLFRKLDRQYRFDALLLTGDPSEYKALLDHLVSTKDWKLRYADPTSLVFRRDGEKVWDLADFEPVRARLADESARDQAMALAKTATKLLAAAQPDAARQLLTEATRLDSDNPDAANGLAIYHLGRTEWREAAEQVERALAADPKFFPALATKAQLLYGTKRFADAFELSRRLIAQLPEDPSLLFYHARIAHEAHAYKAEIEALEKLIARAESEARPVGGYQIYLGQAYASAGDARRSIDAFMLALNDPDLPEDQRAFARENIARIKKRTGL